MTLTGNSAEGGQGGGAHIVGANTVVTLDDIVVSEGDTATSNGGGLFFADASNGALTATLADSTVESNSAMFEGGGVGVQGADLTIERTQSSATTYRVTVPATVLPVAFRGSRDPDAPRLDGVGEHGTGDRRRQHVEHDRDDRAFDNRRKRRRHGVCRGVVDRRVRPRHHHHQQHDQRKPRRDGGRCLRRVPLHRDGDLDHTTVTANDTQGLVADGGAIRSRGSVIAGNGGPTQCTGTVASLGHNLSDGSCGTGPGDVVAPDPQLGPLASNGGRTPTHEALAGSPVVDADDSAFCPATDQRGLNTHAIGDGDGVARCDIGAYERAEEQPPGTPDAVDDMATTLEDTAVTIPVLANDHDPDGDPLTVSIATQPANGSATVNANGTVTFTPVADFHGRRRSATRSTTATAAPTQPPSRSPSRQ